MATKTHSAKLIIKRFDTFERRGQDFHNRRICLHFLILPQEIHYQLKKFTEMLTGGQPPPHWRGEGTLLDGASAVRGAPLSSPLCTNTSENVYITGTYRISLIVSKYAGARNSPSYSTIFCHWNLSCKVKFRSQMWYLFPPFVSTSKEGSKQYLIWYPLPIRLGTPEKLKWIYSSLVW